MALQVFAPQIRRCAAATVAHDRAFSSFPNNLHEIKKIEDYNNHAYANSKVVVAFFGAKFSTPSLVMRPEFEKLASSNPDHTFLTVDIDECPRASYHGDVDDVPTVVVMKGDDAYRVKVVPNERGTFDEEIMTKVKTAMDNAPQGVISSQRAWWDHNIRIDNLNIGRVGWPTQ